MRGLRDAHVGLDPTHDDLRASLQVKAIGARSREDGLLDARLLVQPQLGRATPEPLGVLLADERRQPHEARGLEQLCARASDALEGGVGTKASWTSTTTSTLRSRSSRLMR